MAAKIKTSTIIVPVELYEKWANKAYIQYGERKIPISVQVEETLILEQNNSYKNPQFIQFSSDLMEKLVLVDQLTYQIQEIDLTILLGPVIGFLLGEQQYYYHDRYLKKLTKCIAHYNKFGGLFIAFRHLSVDWNNRIVYGLFYDPQVKKWSYGKMPIPTVIYRRSFTFDNSFVNKIREQKDMFIFNEVRFDKWQMYNLLNQDLSFRTFLPETERLLSVDSLRFMLKKHKKVILKPVDLSRGRGISLLEKDEGKIKVHDHGSDIPYYIEENNLKILLENGKYLKSDYIIQQYIKLAKISNAPWDIRIMMQKDPHHHWKCSGIECRVGGTNRVVTNISNGGKAMAIKEALSESFITKVETEKIESEIIQISHQFCEIMDQTGYLFAEFGIDLALDQNLNYWFIEANVLPTFNGFKSLDMEIYKKLCENPVLFACSIAGFKKDVNK